MESGDDDEQEDHEAELIGKDKQGPRPQGRGEGSDLDFADLTDGN